MNLALVTGAGAGLVAAGQQAASMLDLEFDKLDPNLIAAMDTVNKQMTQGFGPMEIAIATLGLPLAYQGIKILAGFADTHRDGKKDMRERDRMAFEAELRLKEERARLALERERVEISRLGPAAPAP